LSAADRRAYRSMRDAACWPFGRIDTRAALDDHR